MSTRRRVIRSLLGGGLLACSHPWLARAASQDAGPIDWPSKRIRIVVPYPPGGLTDSLGRLLADQLRALGPQGAYVENRPGAGTLLAGREVAKSPADGYTLMVATSTTLGISQALFSNPLVQVNELSGIAMLGTVTLFLLARPDFPATTVPELISVLKAKPGTYTFASPGNGTPHHLLSEMLKSQAGVATIHVPYNGSSQAITDVLGGRADLLFIDATVALPQMKAGTVRALATTASGRSELAPKVPALSEFYPNMDLQVWQAVVGPPGIPNSVVARLNDEINKMLSAPQFRARLIGMGLEPRNMSSEEFNTMIRKDAPRWVELVKRSGAKVD